MKSRAFFSPTAPPSGRNIEAMRGECDFGHFPKAREYPNQQSLYVDDLMFLISDWPSGIQIQDRCMLNHVLTTWPSR